MGGVDNSLSVARVLEHCELFAAAVSDVDLSDAQRHSVPPSKWSQPCRAVLSSYSLTDSSFCARLRVAFDRRLSSI